jgi:hypothetical protein
MSFWSDPLRSISSALGTDGGGGGLLGEIKNSPIMQAAIVAGLAYLTAGGSLGLTSAGEAAGLTEAGLAAGTAEAAGAVAAAAPEFAGSLVGYGGATGALVEAAGGFGVTYGSGATALSLGELGVASAGLTAAGLSGAGGTVAASSWIPGISNNTLLGVGANALSGLVGSNAAGKAAQAQADAANAASANSLTASRESNALQKQMFDKQVALQEPFRQAGLTGQNRLMDILGLSGNTGAQGYGSANEKFGDKPFTQDPSYQWRLQQGQQALERSAAARGGLLSGRAAKDTTAYAQGAASQEYGNAFNRFQTERANTLNPLQSLSGMAQTASGAMSNAADNYGSNVGNNITNTANQVGQNMQGAGNARASGYMGQANALSGAVSGGLGYLQNQNMLDLYNNKRGGW